MVRLAISDEFQHEKHDRAEAGLASRKHQHGLKACMIVPCSSVVQCKTSERTVQGCRRTLGDAGS
jgi:hypothetical protein